MPSLVKPKTKKTDTINSPFYALDSPFAGWSLLAWQFKHRLHPTHPFRRPTVAGGWAASSGAEAVGHVSNEKHQVKLRWQQTNLTILNHDWRSVSTSIDLCLEFNNFGCYYHCILMYFRHRSGISVVQSAPWPWGLHRPQPFWRPSRAGGCLLLPGCCVSPQGHRHFYCQCHRSPTSKPPISICRRSFKATFQWDYSRKRKSGREGVHPTDKVCQQVNR